MTHQRRFECLLSLLLLGMGAACIQPNFNAVGKPCTDTQSCAVNLVCAPQGVCVAPGERWDGGAPKGSGLPDAGRPETGDPVQPEAGGSDLGGHEDASRPTDDAGGPAGDSGGIADTSSPNDAGPPPEPVEACTSWALDGEGDLLYTTSTYAQIFDQQEVAPAEQYELWFKTDEAGITLLDIGAGLRRISLSEQGQLQVFVAREAAACTQNNNNRSYANGSWHHVSVSIGNRDDTNVYFYINGSRACRTNRAVNPDELQSRHLVLGAANYCVDQNCPNGTPPPSYSKVQIAGLRLGSTHRYRHAGMRTPPTRFELHPDTKLLWDLSEEPRSSRRNGEGLGILSFPLLVEDGPYCMGPAPASVDLGLGQEANCVRSGDLVQCMGDNESNFGVGDGTPDNRTTPTSIARREATPGQTLALASGATHHCILTGDRHVWCWGNGADGRLGWGQTGDRSPPVEVLTAANTPLANVRSINLGQRHSCALKLDGTVWCWGRAFEGQIGTGNEPATHHVYAVRAGNLADIISIGTGGHSCALDRTEEVRCWGPSQFGQAGIAAGTQYSPTRVEGISAVELSVGYLHTCVRKSHPNEGTVWCWGDNREGQLGLGALQDPPQSTNLPMQIPNIDNARHIAAGHSHTCILLNDFTVKCTGNNDLGTLGLNGANRTVPTLLPLSPVAVLASSSMSRSNMAVNHHGHLYVWGQNTTQMLGLGEGQFTPYYSAPTRNERINF